MIADDDARTDPGDGRSQRRMVASDELSESDRAFLDAVDEALGVDPVLRNTDGSVDVPALLASVGVKANDVHPIARRRGIRVGIGAR